MLHAASNGSSADNKDVLCFSRVAQLGKSSCILLHTIPAFCRCICRTGTVTIKAKSLQACAPTCATANECNAGNNLFLYKGTGPADPTGMLIPGQGNVKVVDKQLSCTEGDCFSVCEDNGIIVLDSIMSYITYTTFVSGREAPTDPLAVCPDGGEMVGTCTIASCGGGETVGTCTIAGKALGDDRD